MAAGKTKELVKKPDFLITSIETAYMFMRTNFRFFVAGAIVFVLAVAAVYGYTIYAGNQEEKAQSVLFQGIRSFEEYTQTGKEESLANAENTFQTLIKQKRGKAYHVAKLYLATIYSLKGKTGEAKSLYQEIVKKSPGTMLKTLAERALLNLDKK
ncbi:MAG: tetratricopeptide repeat protein [Syntrophorhabdus aromaticivorans]|uniref:Tetratricopeptide repeat protein n=1 Tax=Syntrophorhabdus aromaticivorans TaxID=328301 RepID=A0A971S1H8_9BACT|nr:tetratricopeptide repeat protein [Syntrophorhabdus aromaticivorans]